MADGCTGEREEDAVSHRKLLISAIYVSKLKYLALYDAAGCHDKMVGKR